MGVPRNFAQGISKNKNGQRLLDTVHAAKRAASQQDPGADKSRAAAEHARATWRDGASDRKS